MWSHQHTNMLYYNPILKITFDATSTSSYCPISLFRVEQNYSRVVSTSSILFKKYFICLFFREKGQEEERGEKHQCTRDISSVASRTIPPCNWGAGPKPVTFPFTGWHSIHWATPARAFYSFLNLFPYSCPLPHHWNTSCWGNNDLHIA